jgi:tRNA threonylcarbamoyladenosine biosynthesis protein TsaB
VIILALDTCLAACSAAVLKDGRVLASASEPMTRGHQERLALLVEAVMTAAGAAFPQLDRIGVTVGPGSFTGLRVGLAFAKGLALALERPCVGIGTLPALAASAGVAGFQVAAVDAGRGHVYLQIFENGAPLMAPDSLTYADAAARLMELYTGGAGALIGPGAHLLRGVIKGLALVDIPTADPSAIARLAAAGPLAPPRPLYLRAPDAKPKTA